jgi:hypothetical protein
MLRRQHLVLDVGLADGEPGPPLFERGVADEVKPGAIMRHLEVESIGRTGMRGPRCGTHVRSWLHPPCWRSRPRI